MGEIGVEAAGKPGDRGAQRERDELVGRRGNADGAGGIFVVTDRAKAEPHPAAVDVEAERDGDERAGENEQRVALAAEAGRRDSADAHLRAKPRLLAHEADEQKAHADCRHRQEIVAQPQRSKADDKPEQAGDHDAGNERQRNRRTRGGEKRGRIGARAVEGRMPQAELTAKAGDHIEAHRQHDIDADDGEHAVDVGAHASLHSGKAARTDDQHGDQKQEGDRIAIEEMADEDGSVGFDHAEREACDQRAAQAAEPAQHDDGECLVADDKAHRSVRRNC